MQLPMQHSIFEVVLFFPPHAPSCGAVLCAYSYDTRFFDSTSQ